MTPIIILCSYLSLGGDVMSLLYEMLLLESNLHHSLVQAAFLGSCCGYH